MCHDFLDNCILFVILFECREKHFHVFDSGDSYKKFNVDTKYCWEKGDVEIRLQSLT